jgi:tRNA (guanine37-N1)-methyltransferase
MRIDVFTLFPTMFDGPLTESILKRAQEAGLLQVCLHNIRDWARDKHHTTDEPPYGGGGGMIMKVEPIVTAVEEIIGPERPPVILTTPSGTVFTQRMAAEFAAAPRLVFLCGRYEGIDDRVRQLVVTHEVSIGDYVLTGGELPTMVMIDAIVRHLPGVLGDPNAAGNDSHATGLLEGGHYTRPPVFRGLSVPAPLQGGDHAEIARYRRQDALRRTWERRPDMLLSARLAPEEQQYLATLARQWVEGRLMRPDQPDSSRKGKRK